MKVSSPAGLGQRVLTVGQYVFAAVGIVSLGYWASVAVHAHVFQSKETHRFAHERETQVTFARQNARSESSTDVRREAPLEGVAIANLAIPLIGLSTVVVEGVEDGDLKLTAGHIPGTALPWEPGNVGIAAHRDTFSGRCV